MVARLLGSVVVAALVAFASLSVAGCNSRVSTDANGLVVVSPDGDAQLSLSLGLRTPGTSSVAVGSSRVPMLQFRATALFDDVILRRVIVRERGTLDALTSITLVELVLDTNRSGDLDGGDILLSSSTFTGSGAFIGATLDLPQGGGEVRITPGTGPDLLVLYSFASNAPRSQTTSANVDGVDVQALSAKKGTSIPVSNRITGASFVTR